MRHLSVVRSLVSVLACSLWCSCATAQSASAGEDEGPLESFLDSEPSGLVCEETRLVGATSFSETCLPRNKVVPVIIDVWEKPQKPRKVKHHRPEHVRQPDHCPRRDAICINGRDCSYDRERRCIICSCRTPFR